MARLKARITELGWSPAGCVEKADLVALLRKASTAAAAAAAAPGMATSSAPGPGDGGAAAASAAEAPPRRYSYGGVRGSRRPSLGATLRRTSLLRQRARRSGARQPQAQVERQAKAKAEIDRILAAKDDLEILGLSKREASQSSLQSRYRILTLQVHPDKCPPDLKEAATAAFHRLEAARGRCLAACGGC